DLWYRSSVHSFPTRRSSDLVLELAGALYADDHARSGPVENRAVVQVGRLPGDAADRGRAAKGRALPRRPRPSRRLRLARPGLSRSEEHTSELQSQSNLVCRL